MRAAYPYYATRTFWLLAIFLLGVPAGHKARSVNSTCFAIQHAISSASNVYWPGSEQYTEDIEHYATSSSEAASCSVEPGTAEDVGTILRILGSSRTPFAVKGGGHATNPGYSSTTGVQIAMSRFSEVTYNAVTKTVDVGAGLIWDDVYAALEPHGVNVVGGRATGIGVAGFSLGGGYSWLTNQYGLTVDNTVAYQLVLPNGTTITVDSSVPDLLFALRGGYNNFGIVTKFTFKAVPQGQVWGGAITYTSDLDAVTAATATFSKNVTDPKAQIITTYNFFLDTPLVSLLLFYDGPTPPAGVFDDFLAIPSLNTDISTRSFLSLVQSANSNSTAGTRGLYNTVSLLSYGTDMLNAVLNETIFWGTRPTNLAANDTLISYAVEPFLPTIFSKASASSSAYPPSRARGLLPLNIYFSWLLPESDQFMHDSAVLSAQQLTRVADAEGQDIGDAGLYGNYAVVGTPVERIFGDNLDRLKATKQKYDPYNVMCLAGGWKI